MRPRLLDLKNGTVIIDQDDWPIVEPFTVYVGTNGYAYYSVWLDGRSWPRTLHSLLVGPTDPGMHIDHINGNKLDNRRLNLRVVTAALNQVNRKRLHPKNTSGARGVGFVPDLSSTNPWRAQITVNKKNMHLGMYPTKEDAIAARQAAEHRYYGELCP
jgi:hypothetical protein